MLISLIFRSCYPSKHAAFPFDLHPNRRLESPFCINLHFTRLIIHLSSVFGGFKPLLRLPVPRIIGTYENTALVRFQGNLVFRMNCSLIGLLGALESLQISIWDSRGSHWAISESDICSFVILASSNLTIWAQEMSGRRNREIARCQNFGDSSHSE